MWCCGPCGAAATASTYDGGRTDLLSSPDTTHDARAGLHGDLHGVLLQAGSVASLARGAEWPSVGD